MKRTLDVLVVDDDAGIRDMLRLALAEAGHRVIAWDGTGAPPDSTVPDVVLLDVRLGNRTAADVVREFDVLARSVIVVMTASMQPEVAVRGLPSTAAVLSKPFDLDVLEATIEAATRSNEPPQAPAAR
jgi:two-component system response regulator (stage 0 sporulation protein F)